MDEIQAIKQDMTAIQGSWRARNTKFKEWLDILNLEDKYKSNDMESHPTSEPATFFNMALYLLTAGAIRHTIPIEGDDAISLDTQSRVERACVYMWRLIDEERMGHGGYAFNYELGFNMLLFGWYSLIKTIDLTTGNLKLQIWSPADTYPRYEDNRMTACLHEYKLDIRAAKRKAKSNGWSYDPRQDSGIVTLQDYFFLDENDALQNIIFIDDKNVIPVTPRGLTFDNEEISLLVAPVAGFPEKSLQSSAVWSGNLGRGIFAASAGAFDTLNKWVAFQLQILREVTEPKWVETSTGTAKVNPDDLKKRGAVFQFSPGEGLQAVVSPPPPIELAGSIEAVRRELAKGTFSDLVYGMGDAGRSGYTTSQLASSSANQILYPYMAAKHFIIADCDRFWLRHLKTSKKAFDVKNKKIEKLHSTDIPEDVSLIVESEVATPKDWMERATVANMLENHLDNTTILDEILKVQDTQEVTRRKSDDLVLDHPMSVNIRLANAYRKFAEYLRYRGDTVQAETFEAAAESLTTQMSAPPPGAATPAAASEAETKRAAGAPSKKTRVRPDIAPPGNLSVERPTIGGV